MDWAAAGFYVFPCIPNGKAPMHKGGFKHATMDVGRIREWWEECPEANIGAAPHASGHFVIDVDDKGDKHGTDTLCGLELVNGGLPATFTVETPTGGRHLWFKGNERSSVEHLGEGLDTRGLGGYVLLPGSALEVGRYTTLRDGHIPEAPEWVGKALHHRGRDSEGAVSDELDTGANISRAVAYLERCVEEGDISIEGAGGNEVAYRVSAMLHDIGVSEEKAVELLLEHWNEECTPPWTESELIDETHSPVSHAYKYSQNEAGSKGLGDYTAEFSGITRNGEPIAGASGASESSRFRLRNEQEQDSRPPPAWVVPGWIQECSTVMLYGPPGSYKSFVALDVALSFGAGKQALGISYTPGAGADVVYAAGEGAIGVEKLRRPAWRTLRRVESPIPFYSVSDVPAAGEDPSSVDEFIAEIERADVKPCLIVFDTLSRMLAGMDENSAKDASLAVKRIEEIKRYFNCVVLVVHHSGKDGKSARGSSAFKGAFDTLIKADKGDDKVVELFLEKQKDAEDGLRHSMKAFEVLDSLALSPHVVKEDITREKIGDDDPTTRERNIIYAILKEHGINNRGNALDTKALADMFLREVHQMPEDPGEAAVAVERKKNALNRKAKGVLKNYVISEHGDTPLWALTAEDC